MANGVPTVQRTKAGTERLADANIMLRRSGKDRQVSIITITNISDQKTDSHMICQIAFESGEATRRQGRSYRTVDYRHRRHRRHSSLDGRVVRASENELTVMDVLDV